MFCGELIRPLPQLLADHAVHRGGKVAFADERRSITYAELEERTRRVATGLIRLGVGGGDRVVLHLADSVETVECYLGVLRAGAVGVCVNPAAAEAELAYMVEDSDAAVIVADEGHWDRVERLRGKREPRLLVRAGAGRPEGDVHLDDLATAGPTDGTPNGDLPRPIDAISVDEVSWIVYTSGTTGRPKGVCLTQRSCLWVVACCWAGIAGLGPDDVVLNPLPLFHSYALDLSVIAVVAVGATAHLVRFSPGAIIDRLRSDPITVLPGVPTMFHYLVNTLGDRTLDAAALRLCISAGAVLPAAVNAAFEERAGVRLLDGYGITETSTMVTLNHPEGTRVPGSCGFPLPGVAVRLVDPATGRDVAPGHDGEVWVSGPNVMVGYHQRPEATEQVLTDGWYHTGDLAHRDPNGFLTITGRTKELIIRGGENIYPAEVEAALIGAPGVTDVAVVGRPHPSLGEVPVAFVVVDGGALDEGRVLDHCRAQLSAFKVPVEVVTVDEIPRTGSGKIVRRLLSDPAVS